MKKFLWALGVTGAAGYYLYCRREDILAYFTNKMLQLERTKNELKDYSAKVQAVKDNALKFTNELQKAQPLLESLSADLQQYALEIEPLTKELNDEVTGKSE